MNFFPIKGIETSVSQLIMGTDYYNPDIQEKVDQLLDAYVRIGGNTLDTAYIYGGGKSEVACGNWLAARGNRKDIVVLTKGGHPRNGVPRINKADIREELETSLERLQTDYVDLYALHRDDESLPVGAILEILNEHLESGKIRALGGSNWTYQRLQEANDYAASHGLVGFSFSSPNLSLAKAKEPYWAGCVSADADTVRWHEQSQLPLLSWSSQARGFFTGRFTKEDTSNEDLVRVFYNDENWERYYRAEKLAGEKGLTTIQIALAYVLNQSFPTAALIGAQTQEEMDSCKEGAAVRLTREEMDWLDLTRDEAPVV
ncbi:aldo/keto reductase [Paenibacillus koleovorans]|uniref:aldo/keto reductase n=1 Tax=Paenibacillus koleovorans TaxID=121608 RepID=UPI000FD8C92B|nr:aldo/keto reductase [Paenibacillus koleovorans]